MKQGMGKANFEGNDAIILPRGAPECGLKSANSDQNFSDSPENYSGFSLYMQCKNENDCMLSIRNSTRANYY